VVIRGRQVDIFYYLVPRPVFEEEKEEEEEEKEKEKEKERRSRTNRREPN